MDQLGGIFGKIGSSVQKNPLQAGTAGLGFLQNWLANRQKDQVRQQYEQLLQRYMSMNPAQVGAGINSMVQPLDQGLTQAVGNSVQGQLGERGLSQSPQIASAIMAQALAPYYQQNLGNAQSAYFDMLKLPLGVPLSPEYSQPADLTGLLTGLFGKGNGTAPAATPATPATTSDSTGSSGGADVADWLPPGMAFGDLFGGL